MERKCTCQTLMQLIIHETGLKAGFFITVSFNQVCVFNLHDPDEIDSINTVYYFDLKVFNFI